MGRNKKDKASVNSRGRQEVECQYELDDKSVTLMSLRRSRKHVLVALVFMVLAVLAVVGYIFMYNNGIVSRRNACWLHQQQVEQLANTYVTENGLASLPAYIETVPNYESLNMKCPDGGTYTWNPVNGQYYCSEHGHWPDGFNSAQSIKYGTSTTTVPKS